MQFNMQINYNHFNIAANKQRDQSRIKRLAPN